jgi:molecular chaperone GrpE (heat shock protein)
MEVSPSPQQEQKVEGADGAAEAAAVGPVLAELVGRIRSLEAQQGYLAQQVAYLAQAVFDSGAGLRKSEALLQEELRRLQSGGPQRAMAAVVYRLFRDVLQVMNQLDTLVALGASGQRTHEEVPWLEALRVLHRQLSSVLGEWGCAPIAVEPMVTPYDPEYHEAVLAEGEVPECDAAGHPIPAGTIVAVAQRGWQVQGTILQYPRVVVR